ncbi:MAG TPA: DNA methyltransferase [Bacillota bacterium]|nr:DNA methyltransferase [Bacillota bacterium]
MKGFLIFRKFYEKRKSWDRMENKLNDLTGAEWLYWTNTIYETNFPPDETHSYRKIHGAMKPPELMADIVRFFTKKGEVVLDPFAGVGGTLLGSMMVGRKAVGIELNPAWVERYHFILNHYHISGGKWVVQSGESRNHETIPVMIQGDCVEVMKGFDDQSFAAIITDPPYGCYHGVRGFRKETNFNMFNDGDSRDFGNSEDYDIFFERIRMFGQEAFRLLQEGRYLVLLIGDRYHNGEYFPLSYHVAYQLRQTGFKWKGIRIWWNKATQRPLRPYAVKSCFIPNITHQNILIMRKESSKPK